MEYFLTRKMQYRGIKLREVLAPKIYAPKIGKPFLSSRRVTLPSISRTNDISFFNCLLSSRKKISQIIDIVFTITFKFVVHYLLSFNFSHFLRIQNLLPSFKVEYFMEKFSKFFQLISRYCSIVSSIEKLKVRLS